MKKLILVLLFMLIILAIWVSVALAGTSYLPIVNKSLTPTPTPTATPLPTPILLPNGDFEQGRVIWHEYSSRGFAIIVNKSTLPVTPYDGSWAAWLGGAVKGVDTLDQTVLVTAERPYLSFWMNIVSTDYCNYDWATFSVNSTELAKIWLCKDNNTNGWVKKVYDLHPFIGQNVLITAHAENDLTNISSLYLDRFMFQASSTAANSVPVIFTNNSSVKTEANK